MTANEERDIRELKNQTIEMNLKVARIEEKMDMLIEDRVAINNLRLEVSNLKEIAIRAENKADLANERVIEIKNSNKSLGKLIITPAVTAAIVAIIAIM